MSFSVVSAASKYSRRRLSSVLHRIAMLPVEAHNGLRYPAKTFRGNIRAKGLRRHGLA